MTVSLRVGLSFLSLVEVILTKYGFFSSPLLGIGRMIASGGWVSFCPTSIATHVRVSIVHSHAMIVAATRNILNVTKKSLKRKLAVDNKDVDLIVGRLSVPYDDIFYDFVRHAGFVLSSTKKMLVVITLKANSFYFRITCETMDEY